MLNRLKELECQFSCNLYNGDNKTDFIILKGYIPIIISAPHATNRYRNGELKYADKLTGAIAMLLNEINGCHVICSKSPNNYDPNFDIINNKYQKRLLNYIIKNNIKLLLDLHGSSTERKYAIDVGTLNNDLISLKKYKNIINLLKKTFQIVSKGKETKKITINNVFSGGKQNTITKFISRNSQCACAQLEINGLYRNLKNKENVLNLINTLIKIIENLHL